MAFDTLTAARSLQAAGMDDRQAEAVVSTVRCAVAEEVATKAGLERLRTEVAAMESRLTWRLLGGMAALLALFRLLDPLLS